MDELRDLLEEVEDGGVCAEWIVEELAGVPRLELSMRRGMGVEADRVERARDWAGRVAGGEPIQYVLGWTSFRGHRIRTDPRALIPRPETEELVSRVREKILGRALVVDVGTGTGCISIALALEEPAVSLLAIDREAGALGLAAENVAVHGLEKRVRLRQGNLLSGVADGVFDIVVSNPPYVAESEMPDLPRNVRDHEPASALVSGPEGLDAIRRLVPEARRCLKPGGWLLLEIGETQATTVVQLLLAAGFDQAIVHPDLRGRDRIVSGCSR